MSDPSPVESNEVAEMAPVDQIPVEEIVVEEILVEEVSIDGMCGVY